MLDFIILVVTSPLGRVVMIGLLIAGAIVNYFFGRSTKALFMYMMKLIASMIFGLFAFVVGVFILMLASYGSAQTPLVIIVYGPLGMLIAGVLFLGVDIYKHFNAS